MESNDLKATMLRITNVLKANQILFHLTGGLASSFYGEPRFTQDIDIVIEVMKGRGMLLFIDSLSKEFIVDKSVIEDAVSKEGLFQALDEATMIKVDFHVGELISGELERSKAEEILPGLTMPIVSREDAILSKLIWIRDGSSKSRQDAKMMLKLADSLDHVYLELKAQELNVLQLLNELQADLEDDR